jgi:hypothetical protein
MPRTNGGRRRRTTGRSSSKGSRRGWTKVNGAKALRRKRKRKRMKRMRRRDKRELMALGRPSRGRIWLVRTSRQATVRP